MPLEPYQALHLYGAGIGLIGLLGVWLLGRLLFGAAGGFSALLLCALTPVYYGHMFNNPKDLPFAVAYVWSLYFLCKAVRRFPAPSWSTWVGLGLAMGASMSVRIGGLLTLCYLLLAVVTYCGYRGLAAHSAEVGFRLLRSIGTRALAAAVLAWGVMLAVWPWAWHAPLQRPLLALQSMSHYTGHRRHLPFGDGMIRSTDPPWDYLPRYLGFKLPEIVLVLALIGLLLGAAHLIARARSERHLHTNLGFALVGVAVLLPPLYAMEKGSALYDGLRHFLFVVPPICVIAAGALVFLTRAAAQRSRALAGSIAFAAALLCAGQVQIMRHLHPHEYVYFNRFVGGLAGAHERYETEYYAAGYREALIDLRAHLWRHEPDIYLNTRYRLGGCFSRMMAAKYVPGNFRKSRKGRQFWLGYTRQNCHRRHDDSPIALTVDRLDTPLVYIRDLRRPTRGTQ